MIYLQPEVPVDPVMLNRMTDIMIHRGPDSRGIHIGRGVGLGIRRLSIIDLETGDQPISNEDGTITVVCNGEIYNFRELRKKLETAGHSFRTKSDVEVIVHLYEIYGTDCVQYLRGMFGFALWDQRLRRLMLARDRLGIKPLFYSIQQDAIYFGSELKSILMSGRVDREPDVAALKDLFSTGFVVAPRTLFRKISRLEAGHTLVYQDGRGITRRYWEPQFPAKGFQAVKRSEGEWAEALRAKLEETVQIHLRSDVPLGAFLSSGIDSSTLVGLMSRLYDGPLRTFSLAFENLNFDEVSRQKILSDFETFHLLNHRAVCKNEDVELLQKAVWHREDPTSIAIEVPLMILSRLASQYVKVAMSGEGSDELFGGYAWFRTDKVLRMLRRIPLGLRNVLCQLRPLNKRPRFSKLLRLPSGMDFIRYKQLMHTSNPNFDERVFSNEIVAEMSRTHGQSEVPRLPEGFDQWHPFTQLQYFEMTVRLPNLITRNLDAASMAYSVEARVPFLDHELLEFCASIPPKLKMRRLQEKYILRRAMNDMIPPEILWRRKRGLNAPFSQWMQNLPEFAMELLSKHQIKTKGYFNADFVAGMIKDHRAGTSNHGMTLMCAIAVHIWDDLFVRGFVSKTVDPNHEERHGVLRSSSALQYLTEFDEENSIGSLVETLDRKNVTNLFVHSALSMENAPTLMVVKPEMEQYPERSLLMARRNDIVCVLDGVDIDFLHFLAGLGVGPSQENIVIIRESNGENRIENLSDLMMKNHHAFSTIRNLVKEGNNVEFHPYVASPKEFSLVSMMQQFFPNSISMPDLNSDVVQFASFKHHMKLQANKLGVPVPPGEIVELKTEGPGKNFDLKPIERTVQRLFSKADGVLIKGSSGSSGTTLIQVDNNSHSLQKALDTILKSNDNHIYLIEPLLDVVVSPNILMFIEPHSGKISCVGVTDQILAQGKKHVGNIYPSQARTIKAMIHSARIFSEWLQSEGYSGIAGFDFMECPDQGTGKRDHYLAEVNARVNASTYPKSLMEYLNRKQMQTGKPVLKAFLTETVRTTAHSFSEIRNRYGELFFSPENGEGLVPFNIGCLKYQKFTLSIFGESLDRVSEIYQQFLKRNVKEF